MNICIHIYPYIYTYVKKDTRISWQCSSNTYARLSWRRSGWDLTVEYRRCHDTALHRCTRAVYFCTGAHVQGAHGRDTLVGSHVGATHLASVSRVAACARSSLALSRSSLRCTMWVIWSITQRLWICTTTCIRLCMYTYTYTYIYVHTYICIYAYMYMYIYIYVCVCVCVCVHVCIYMSIYIYLYIFVYTYMLGVSWSAIPPHKYYDSVFKTFSLSLYIHICKYIYLYMYIYICICTYMYRCIYTYICIYICMCVCMCIHI